MAYSTAIGTLNQSESIQDPHLILMEKRLENIRNMLGSTQEMLDRILGHSAEVAKSVPTPVPDGAVGRLHQQIDVIGAMVQTTYERLMSLAG